MKLSSNLRSRTLECLTLAHLCTSLVHVSPGLGTVQTEPSVRVRYGTVGFKRLLREGSGEPHDLITVSYCKLCNSPLAREPKRAKLWCGVAWCGCEVVKWLCGVVWCGVVRCGVVWCGVVWCGVVGRDV